ncbi:MAG: HNH endonuclease [Acidobacteriota bacterium]|nr:MAG: HNH endonuclease [Acidobacteriota bacterium]
MGIRTWTTEQIEFLRENCGRLSYAEIAERLGKTAAQCKSQASNLGFTRSRKWPDADIELLRQMYPDHRSIDIAERLGRKLSAVHWMANKLGLKKSDAFNASELCGRITKENRVRRGLEHRFPKGHKPWNAGTKGLAGLHPNSRRTQFKKGSLSGRAAEVVQPIGTERLQKDGYRQRKVNNDLPFHRRWKMVHHIVWEQHNGPIPPGHNVVFRDGDKANITIENLELVSRTEWIDRHRAETLYPEPLVKAIRQLAGMKRRLKRYAKEQDRRSQKPAV